MMTNGEGKLALEVEDPAIRALNGIMVSRMHDLRRLQWTADTMHKRLSDAGDYRLNPTSYEELPGHHPGRYYAPEREWTESAEIYARMGALHRECVSLQQAKLGAVRDCDFHTGEYWIPILLSGRDLHDPLDQDHEALQALLATNPVAVGVSYRDGGFHLLLTTGSGEPAASGGNALALLDLLVALSGNEASVAVHGADWAEARAVLVPAGILVLQGVKRPVLTAGLHAAAFRHALRLAIRVAGGGNGVEE